MSDAQTSKPFSFLELSAPVALQERNLIREIASNELPGVIVRGAYTGEEMQRIDRRLSQGEARDALFAPPSAVREGTVEQHHHYYGMNLVTPKATRQMYQEFAQRFDIACRALFRDLADFRELLMQTVRNLGAGMGADVPAFASGEPYTFATLRGFPPGLEVPLHCGNHMVQVSPAYEHLRTLTSHSHDQLSFFMPIGLPDAGGELIVYDLYWEPEHSKSAGSLHGDAAMVKDHAWQAAELNPGDMIFFNGGRIYHRVSKVEGSRLRRTIGGFLSVSSDLERAYLYS
ncbi:hypothetical protein [Haliangium ochraceum]|uniref:Fe2OG dioxygenase domain-containing protein n=1 Tax=Haliangium ochraceum (strain DSM 14365 / JCM 11303 / SMP-2) TaxID=502025 RepID=D0LP54_HALO1|nr:hypothetical protein [Haliangium ochraceum]ACY13419.1 hypothetical protein Hoch_0803 [Haliangium ochraceum DSM 14365]